MRKTFQQIATELEVPYCGGVRKGFYCHEQHDLAGSVVDGTIHMRDHKSGRPSAQVAFLKMVARARDPSLDTDIPWRRVYRTDAAVYELARRIHIRPPKKVFDFDRAFVRAGVAGLSNDIPMRKQAYDWSRR